MASIELYKSKINSMSNYIAHAKSAVSDFCVDLSALKKKVLGINSSVCDSIVSSISSSSKTQEQLIEGLEATQKEVDAFIKLSVERDKSAADEIVKQKKDFYKAYSYLKPESEKSRWEKFCDKMKKVGEWCKDHWKLLTAIALITVAVFVIVATAGTALGPIAALMVAASKGLIIGAVIGGLTGGIFSALCGKSFFEGFEEGLFSGAISGAFAGGLCSWLSGGGELALSVGKQMLCGGAGDLVASVIGDVGDIAIKNEKLSLTDVLFNAGFSFGVGALSTGATSFLSNYCPLKIKGINKGRGSWEHVWKTQSIRSLRHGTRVQMKTIMKGFGADFVNGVWDYGFEFPKNLVSEIREAVAN